MRFLLEVLSYLARVIQPVLEQRAAELDPKLPLDLIGAFLAGAQIGIAKW